MLVEGEEIGQEILVIEQKVEGDSDINMEVNRNDNDEERKFGEEGKIGKE